VGLKLSARRFAKPGRKQEKKEYAGVLQAKEIQIKAR
jgi:hypothetical protein